MAEIGSSLREARMRARIDISEVEASTKIRAKYLRAIENEEWDLLPGPVYVKSFLRTYGDYLGLDSRMLVDEFKRRYERPSDHDQRPLSALARDRERAARAPRGPALTPRVLVGVVLVGVLAALFVIGELFGGQNGAPPVTTAGKTHHHHRGGTRGGRHATTPSTTTASTPVRTTTTPAAPASATLQITPTSTVWLCVEKVVHGRATPLFHAGDFVKGQTVPRARGRELLVTFGNAAVTLKINGRPYPLTASSQAIGLKVTPTRVSTLPAARQPTCA